MKIVVPTLEIDYPFHKIVQFQFEQNCKMKGAWNARLCVVEISRETQGAPIACTHHPVVIQFSHCRDCFTNC